jgi:hypothetical protein
MMKDTMFFNRLPNLENVKSLARSLGFAHSCQLGSLEQSRRMGREFPLIGNQNTVQAVADNLGGSAPAQRDGHGAAAHAFHDRNAEMLKPFGAGPDVITRRR